MRLKQENKEFSVILDLDDEDFNSFKNANGAPYYQDATKAIWYFKSADEVKKAWKKASKEESVMIRHFIFNEDTRIPGTNFIFEKGDKVYVKEAMIAGLNCSNVQSIITPKFKYIAHVKYGGLDSRPCPKDLKKIVLASGFYKNGEGFRKTQRNKNWDLSYLGRGRVFRLSLEGDIGPREDYIIVLR